jgi:NADH-quinone oxidoreductase subunit D
MMELNRISSHLVWLATGSMEIGALSAMLYGFRERETVLDFFERITGLRMNMGYVRPGGLAVDLPAGVEDDIRAFLPVMAKRIDEYEKLLSANPIWRKRLEGVGHLDAQGCIALGVTGPLLRAAGLPWDTRKTMPYCGYDTYDFDVPIATAGDNYARYQVRLEEMRQSLRIVEQCLDRLRPGPVMVADKKIAWPAQLALGGDGLGNSLDHIREIMGTSMEALIHHFKLVTEGFRVPAGQVYVPVESPRGELGAHIVSTGGSRPHRVHMRDPSFVNLQAVPALAEGSYIADVIGSVASIDPVLGGVDR